MSGQLDLADKVLKADDIEKKPSIVSMVCVCHTALLLNPSRNLL